MGRLSYQNLTEVGSQLGFIMITGQVIGLVKQHGYVAIRAYLDSDSLLQYMGAMLRKCRCACCVRRGWCGCCGTTSLYDEEVKLFGDWRTGRSLTRIPRTVELTPKECVPVPVCLV